MADVDGWVMLAADSPARGVFVAGVAVGRGWFSFAPIIDWDGRLTLATVSGLVEAVFDAVGAALPATALDAVGAALPATARNATGAALPDVVKVRSGSGIGKSAMNTACHALEIGEPLDSSAPFLSARHGSRGLVV